MKYSYAKFGQIASKVMGDSKSPMASLKYVYAKDGSITAREVNGKLQKYEYDLKGQLLAVKDSSGKAVESYAYDKAGNILEKTINGETTKYTYDSANQLVSAILPDGSLKKYAYDAAGRMISEATPSETKTYTYGWLDKVTKVDSGITQSAFSYFTDGQLAEKTSNGETEKFYWDGLALIKRDKTDYVNEPAMTGGNPIIANDKVLFNDMLGTTIGNVENNTFTPTATTAFGAGNEDAFFTGKPYVEGLGHAFLFRNYRPEIGKWQTADPLGYPDGWNNFAYCNNWLTECIDRKGTDIFHLVDPNGAINVTGEKAGHSGWIIGNEMDGYTAYDYQSDSSSGSGSESRQQHSLSFQDAVDFLNSNRGADHQFTKMQVLETSDRLHDGRAMQAAEAYMSYPYNMPNHNCYQLGSAVVDAINSTFNTSYNISRDRQPNNAFESNQKLKWTTLAE